MGRRPNQTRAREQRELRRRRGERAFLFDKDVAHCLGEVAREDWEWAVSISGGNVATAARECGVYGIPPSAKALWGTSAQEAADLYRRWLKRRKQQNR